jgi:hypothetical protein
MKKVILAGLVSVLVVSAVAFGNADEQRKDSSMSGMMQGMMKGENSGETGTGDMMRMMKMMDQCSAMMESAKESSAAKESQKQ